MHTLGVAQELTPALLLMKELVHGVHTCYNVTTEAAMRSKCQCEYTSKTEDSAESIDLLGRNGEAKVYQCFSHGF